MPIETNLIDNGRGLEIMMSGVVHGKEVIAAQNSEVPKEFLLNIRYFLIDYTRVDRSYVSHEEIKIIAKNDRKRLLTFPHLYIAAVVPNRLFHSVAGVWIANTENSTHVKRFTNRVDAERWLDETISHTST